MKKISSLIAAGLLSVLALTGCSMAYEGSTVKPLVSADVQDSEAVLETLRWAKVIELKKAALSINDVYSVKADGVEIGEIRGQYIYSLGDTYSFFSTAGNLVASEGEGHRLVTHEAELFDYSNEPSGFINENVSWPLTNWSIYDEEAKEIGRAQQNLSIALDFTINDINGTEQYRIQKDFISITGSKLAITNLTNEPTVHGLNAVWLAAITNEVAEAEEAKD